MAVSVAPTAHSQSLEYIDGTSSRVSGSLAMGSVNFQTSSSDSVADATGTIREWRHGIGYDVVAYVEDAWPPGEPPYTVCKIKIVIDSDSALGTPDEWRLHSENGYFYTFTGNEVEFHVYPPLDNWGLPTYYGFSNDLYFSGMAEDRRSWLGTFDIDVPVECPVPDGQSEVSIASGWADRME